MAIDKAKGIICKPMPKEWHDRYAASQIKDPEKRAMCLRIVADRKPYFMRYIYPDLMRQYNTYIDRTNKNCIREFKITMEELLNMPTNKLTDRQREFISYYYNMMPVGYRDCLMNRICRKVENEFAGYMMKARKDSSFDYTVMKSGVEYSRRQYDAMLTLYRDYTKRLKEYSVFASVERFGEDEADMTYKLLKEDFIRKCDDVSTDSRVICDILLDICYQKSGTKRFCWDMCADQIVENLLDKHDRMIQYPTADKDGDIVFSGERFKIVSGRL